MVTLGMIMDKRPLDRSKLTVDQVAQLDQYETSQKQLQAIQDLGQVLEHLTISVTEGNDQNQTTADQLGPLLIHIKEALDTLKSKEDPQLPDYAKPVVEALSSLETSLKEAISGIDTKPEVNLPAPMVKVDAPIIDLSKVEKALKTDIPMAFKEAMGLLPEVPEADFTPLTELLRELSTKLDGIELATRLKPLPGVMKVINADGSAISGGGLTDTELRASVVGVKDDFYQGEILADQNGAAGVLTFTFTAPVQRVFVINDGAAAAVARVDPFGGTPSATLGIPIYYQKQEEVEIETSAVKVYAPASTTISIWGLRRTIASPAPATGSAIGLLLALTYA